MTILQPILDKYFKDERTVYFNPGDVISNEQYVQYRFLNGEINTVVICLGSDNGDVEVGMFHATRSQDAQRLANLLSSILGR